MALPTIKVFGPWISTNAYAPTATSGTAIGTIQAVPGPATNLTVQTNIIGAFSGTVNVQLIGSLDGTNFSILASGLGSGLNFVALNGPVFWVATQVTSSSGAGNVSTSLTTYVWQK